MGYVERFILGKNNAETREFEKVLNIIEEAGCGEPIWHRLFLLKQDWKFDYECFQGFKVDGVMIDMTLPKPIEISGNAKLECIFETKTFFLKKGTELIWVAGARGGLYCIELPEIIGKLEQAEILTLDDIENIDALINDEDFMDIILTENEIVR